MPRMPPHVACWRRACFSAVLLCACLQRAPAAQVASTPETGRAQASVPFLLGRVIDADTRVPVAGAIVDLQGRGEPPPRKLTDARGRFVFRDLAPGTYRLRASAAGYVEGGYGQAKPGDPIAPLTIAPGPGVGGHEIRLWKFAAVRGRVIDPDGEPITGVSVTAFRLTSARGLPDEMDSRRPSATTDDRGEYAITGLEPGDYIVGVSLTTITTSLAVLESPGRSEALPAGPRLPARSTPAANHIRVGNAALRVSPALNAAFVGMKNGRAWVRPSAFFAGARAPAQARVLTMRAGESRAGIDIALREVAAVAITGRIAGYADASASFAVRLRPAGDDNPRIPIVLDVARTETDASGSFTLLGVPPGQYVIVAEQLRAPNQPGRATPIPVPGERGPAREDPPVAWARMPVNIDDEDVRDLAIAIRSGLTIRGRLTVDPRVRGAAAEPTQVWMNGEVAGRRLNTAGAKLSKTGEFSFTNLAPGRYTFFVDGYRGWTISSIRIGSRVVDGPVVVDEDVGNLTLVITKRQ